MDGRNWATVFTMRLNFWSKWTSRLAMGLGSEARDPGKGVGGIIRGLVMGERAVTGENKTGKSTSPDLRVDSSLAKFLGCRSRCF